MAKRFTLRTLSITALSAFVLAVGAPAIAQAEGGYKATGSEKEMGKEMGDKKAAQGMSQESEAQMGRALDDTGEELDQISQTEQYLDRQEAVVEGWAEAVRVYFGKENIELVTGAGKAELVEVTEDLPESVSQADKSLAESWTRLRVEWNALNRANDKGDEQEFAFIKDNYEDAFEAFKEAWDEAHNLQEKPAE